MKKRDQAIKTYEYDKWETIEMLASEAFNNIRDGYDIDWKNSSGIEISHHCEYNVPNSVHQLISAIEGASQGGKTWSNHIQQAYKDGYSDGLNYAIRKLNYDSLIPTSEISA